MNASSSRGMTNTPSNHPHQSSRLADSLVRDAEWAMDERTHNLPVAEPEVNSTVMGDLCVFSTTRLTILVSENDRR